MSAPFTKEDLTTLAKSIKNSKKARQLAVFALLLDIITFAVGFGFIFVAIGHDANSGSECTSLNGLCKGTAPDCTNNIPATLQCGQITVTISAGGTTGIASASFSPAFARKPNVTLTPLGTLPPGIFASSFTFQAPGNSPQTWTAMPAAETYIYTPAILANDCCTIIAPGAGLSGLSCSFIVDVNVASTSATAVLILRYSSGSNGPWTDVGTGINVGVGNTGPQTMTVTFPTLTDVVDYLSVWGKNGNGVADNPAFGVIGLGCTLNNNGGWFLTYNISVNGFNVEVLDNAPASFTNSVTFNWKATNG